MRTVRQAPPCPFYQTDTWSPVEATPITLLAMPISCFDAVGGLQALHKVVKPEPPCLMSFRVQGAPAVYTCCVTKLAYPV